MLTNDILSFEQPGPDLDQKAPGEAVWKFSLNVSTFLTKTSVQIFRTPTVPKLHIPYLQVFTDCF